MEEYNKEENYNYIPNQRRYKLTRLKKAGIAIGLTFATISTAFIGTVGKIMYDSAKPISPSTQKQATSSAYVSTVTNDYIDSIISNELRVYDEEYKKIPITLTNYSYLNYLDKLNSNDCTFKMEKYYGLEEAINLYKNTKVNKSTDSDLLDQNGHLDTTKLTQKVLQNNQNYMVQEKNSINIFYEDLEIENITKICTLITEVVNNKLSDNEIKKVANTLTKLTMFKKTGSASNAYITNDLTFVYNPSMSGMYADVKQITGEINDTEVTLDSIIVHEIMHLLKYRTNDNNDANGIEAGMCRMYNVPNMTKKLEVDSLWNTWLLEAAAELGMADYLKIKPGTYAKKISYVRSYNLSRFNELNLENHGLEDVAFNHTLEQTYEDLNLKTEEEQKEFLNYLFSVEITQSDPKEFWEHYTNLTGTNPTPDEKTAIRMDIRTDAVKYLTRNFYNNLTTAIYEESITDINTVFYLMRTWELDVFNHLEYTKTSCFSHAEDFIKYHNEIQSQLFEAIAESNTLTTNNIEEMYNEYNLQINTGEEIYDNCDLNKFSVSTSDFITSAKQNYNTTKFSRNIDVLKSIERLNKNTETIKITK